MRNILPLSFILACGAPKITDSADTSAAEPGDGFPENPAPFTIQTTGAESLSLTFNEPSCSSPTGSSNMRVFWRNSSSQHVFVLVAEVLGMYNGEGSYTPPSPADPPNRVAIKLQEEAGGQARYYASDENTAALEVNFEIVEEERFAGYARVSSIFGSDGELTLEPSEWPLWCDNIER